MRCDLCMHFERQLNRLEREIETLIEKKNSALSSGEKFDQHDLDLKLREFRQSRELYSQHQRNLHFSNQPSPVAVAAEMATFAA